MIGRSRLQRSGTQFRCLIQDHSQIRTSRVPHRLRQIKVPLRKRLSRKQCLFNRRITSRKCSHQKLEHRFQFPHHSIRNLRTGKPPKLRCPVAATDYSILCTADDRNDKEFSFRSRHGHIKKTDRFGQQFAGLFLIQHEKVVWLIFCLPFRIISDRPHLSLLIQTDRGHICIDSFLQSAKEYIRKLQTLALVEGHDTHHILKRCRKLDVCCRVLLGIQFFHISDKGAKAGSFGLIKTGSPLLQRHQGIVPFITIFLSLHPRSVSGNRIDMLQPLAHRHLHGIGAKIVDKGKEVHKFLLNTLLFFLQVVFLVFRQEQHLLAEKKSFLLPFIRKQADLQEFSVSKAGLTDI